MSVPGTAGDQEDKDLLHSFHFWHPIREIQEDGAMNTTKRYSAEVRDRAARMVLEHRSGYASEWKAIGLRIGNSRTV